jgi:ketosteroid isomerase-like protein
MSVQKVELLREATDAFNRRDGAAFDALLARYAEIVPVRAALEGTVYRGADAGSQYCAAVDETWESLHWEVEEVRDVGDAALALGHIRGRGQDSGCRHRHICGVGRPVPWWADRSLPYIHRPR